MSMRWKFRTDIGIIRQASKALVSNGWSNAVEPPKRTRISVYVECSRKKLYPRVQVLSSRSNERRSSHLLTHSAHSNALNARKSRTASAYKSYLHFWGLFWPSGRVPGLLNPNNQYIWKYYYHNIAYSASLAKKFPKPTWYSYGSSLRGRVEKAPLADAPDAERGMLNLLWELKTRTKLLRRSWRPRGATYIHDLREREPNLS